MEGGIYTITNTINNKVYVGSSNDVNKRIRKHKESLTRGTHYNIHIQRSYNKSKDAFKFELLENCEDHLRIDLENYWVNILDSRNTRLGYNIADPYGTRLEYHEVAVDQYTKDGTFVQSFRSTKIASKELNLDASTITKMCKGTVNYLHGFTFRYKGEPLGRLIKGLGKQIDQYDLNNNFIATWDSTAQIGRHFNCDPSGISRVCRGLNKTAMNFKWKYYGR